MEQTGTTDENEQPMETDEKQDIAVPEMEAKESEQVEKLEMCSEKGSLPEENTECIKENSGNIKETSDSNAEKPENIQEISDCIRGKSENNQDKSDNIEEKSDCIQEICEIIDEKSDSMDESSADIDNSDIIEENSENIQEKPDTVKEDSDQIQKPVDDIQEEPSIQVQEKDECNKPMHPIEEVASTASAVKESDRTESTETKSATSAVASKESKCSKPQSPSQHQTETVEESTENKRVDSASNSSSSVPKEACEKGGSLPVPQCDSYEDSLTELKLIFDKKNKPETESQEESPSKTNKSSYENQFEQFILQAQASKKPASDDPDSNNDSNKGKGRDLKSSNMNFKAISEDTSNSSWYKLGSSAEQTMEISEPVVQEDISNLSAPDNASVVSSNIGDSCMSFPDQGSNIDESSNLSIPDDSVPLQKYTGHTPDFDESANMNPPSNVTFIRPDTPSSVLNDTSESTPAKKTRRGTLQIAVDDASEHGHNITAADVFEYQWPQDKKDGDHYILQEQISIFLDIKSFKRKYPDLFRRVCDKHEKDFLREKGVVSETQSDLGLTALKSDEVCDLMGRDYPAKFKEYLKVIHDRERQKMAEKMREHDALKLEKDKMIEYTRRAMKSASDWNRNMLKERNEERRAYFDMQTFSIQYPKSKFRKLDSVKSGVTAYPLSLIPGQFQDYYRKYNSEELKYFPLNTTLFDPPKKVDQLTRQRQLQQMEEETESQEDEQRTGTGSFSGSDSDDDSSSSSSDDSDGKENDEVAPSNNGGRQVKRKEKSSSREASKEKTTEVVGGMSLQPVVKLEIMECRICKEDKGKVKKNLEEEMIRCSECKSTGHPSCLDLTDEMVKIIKTYPWQCMECKTCVQCMDPYDEDKMMFCDKCDRGYHTFCVGLKSLPTGHWECKSCRGDSTPVKPIPRPTPKSKRGRKPLNKGTPRPEPVVKEESQQSRDRPAPSPARERPLREKAAQNKAGITTRAPSRDSLRASRESSRSSMKDD